MQTTQSKQTQHTAVPWFVEIDAHGRGRIKSVGSWVATTWTAADDDTSRRYPAEANAQFIVRAVNSHDDLLAACRAALLVIPQHPFNMESRAIILDAIARATGQEVKP